MREDSIREYQRRIHRALAFIEDEIGDDLKLERVAKIACFSLFHFHRIFRG